MDATDSSPGRLGQPPRNIPPSSTAPQPSASATPLYRSPQPAVQPLYPHRWREEVLYNEKLDLKSRPTLDIPLASSIPPLSTQYPTPQCSYSPRRPTPIRLASSSRSVTTLAYTRPRGLRIANLLKPWTPIMLYALTSFGFLAAIAFWKAEVFQGLDDLSSWLRADEYIGYASIFLMIFITTIPPLPLYSTLIILSGYTFGPWTGAVISYLASLSGALFVFIVSRACFRESISRWLSCTLTIKRVVRAIEKRPKLLFLIRLAPYPFNVMNCLLAAAPTLTLRTYTLCTALSLFKLIIHTMIGASIRSFAEYHVVKPGQSAPERTDESTLAHYSTIAGVALCIAILVYLSCVARRAVDDELLDDVVPSRDSEETLAFLSYEDGTLGDMEEVPESRPASRTDTRFIYGGREEAIVGL